LNLGSTGLHWRALRPLRPLLLAGAAAMAWLALSAPAATADTASDSGSLPGGLGSSVSSLAAPGQSSLGNAVSSAAGAIGSVPLLEQVVPADTVGAVIAPVSGGADAVVETAAQALLPPAGAALPVLDPVLQPVGDVLTGIGGLQLPVPAAGQVLAPVFMPPAGLPGFEAESGTVAGRALPDAKPASSAGMFGGVPAWADAAAAPFGSAGPGTATASAAPSDATESPADGDWIPGPEALPAVPSSGSGSGQSSAGPAGAAAWLSDLSPDAPQPGAFPINGPLQGAPSPVSFDPGSSPD
jgi:hypothetical protein